MLRVLSVDLGATSARVVAVDLDASPPSVEVVHRHAHRPVRRADGSLRWDWDGLRAAVVQGLQAALAAGPAASIGIDAWGVDYGLLDREGRLLSEPYSYRDERTASWRDVAASIGVERLYRVSGIQLLAINTVFQLAAHDRKELERAHRLLMIPELVVHELTGIETGERTSAGTTALVDLATGGWSEELLADIAVDPRLLPPVASAGRCVGTWRGVSVHLVGGHDTASAVVAMPGPPVECSAFVSSGTWLLVGAERPEAETSDAARLANFSNERGALAGVRFLKNLAGLWLLEECRRGWGSPAVEELVAAAEAAGPSRALVDPNDARFVAPVDMEAEVRAAAGLPTGAGRDRVVRTIVESLAAATAGVVHELEAFLGRPVPEVRVLGGGARNRLLTRLTEEACGVPVRTGPGEATALGNALVQGIALGRFSGLTEARAALSPEAD